MYLHMQSAEDKMLAVASISNARAQAAYGVRSAVNKVRVINREITPGRITVVLVDEVLGF